MNSDILLTEHIEWAIDLRNQSFVDSVGAPRIPNVTWEDVGGLTDVKTIICESLEMSLRGEKGLKRSGVILYGPPGCGKTLTAKAVANEFKVTFLSVKGPELLNKYVGQSECNVRKVFERAKLASPCVVFFDELDSLAPNRGRSGDSAGVADRIVSQLLSELDSLGDSKIFVLGATNRPDLLDPSLLMPGRFDKIIRVDGGVDAETKERVLRAVSRNVNFAADVDLAHIARQCSGWMSGADLHAIISRATMHAIRARVEQIESGMRSMEECPIVITNVDLSAALDEVSSSLSRAEFAIYNSMDTFA
uniref:Peroxisomal ATPase PEX6 n=1 Tax=Parascaris univalens TaxID=6257 RepID=A0A915CGC9_PARUN